MRKLILFLSVLLSLFIASCDNDPIEVAVDNTQKYNITVKTDISAVYGSFGNNVENSIKGLLSQDNFEIGLFMFLYDREGNRVDSLFTHSKTLQFPNLSFNEKVSGNYKLVSIVTLVVSEYDYKSIYWNITESEKLSTLKILEIDRTPYQYAGIVGLTCSDIDLSSNQTQNVNVQPLGTVLYCGWENLESSGIGWIGLERKQKPMGYLVDPSVTNHYIDAQYNKNNTWSGILYSEDISDSKFKHVYYILDSGDIEWCWALGKAGTNNFTSFNESHLSFKNGSFYYAYLYYDQNGKFYSYMDTSIEGWQTWYNGLDKAKDKVLFEEPYLTFGGTVSDVQKFMKDYEIVETTPNYNSDLILYVLSYYGKHKEGSVQYMFTSSTEGLEYVLISLETSKASLNDIKEHFKETGMYEDYGYIDDANKVYAFVDEDNLIVAEISKNESGNMWIILYYKLKPQNETLFREPYLTFGGTVANVKKYMEGYEAYSDSPEYDSDLDMYFLTYYGKNKESLIDYWFTSSTTGLDEVLVYFNAKNVGHDELFDFYRNAGSYTEVGEIDGIDDYYFFLNESTNVIVGLVCFDSGENGEFWIADYFQLSDDSSAPMRRNQNISSTKNQITNIFKNKELKGKRTMATKLKKSNSALSSSNSFSKTILFKNLEEIPFMMK